MLFNEIGFTYQRTVVDDAIRFVSEKSKDKEQQVKKFGVIKDYNYIPLKLAE